MGISQAMGPSALLPGLVLLGTNSATSGTTCDVVSCLSASYDSYRIVVSDFRTTGPSDIGFTLLSNTTAAASNWVYSRTRMDYGAGTWTHTKASSASSAYVGVTTTNAGGAAFDLINPYLSQNSAVFGVGIDARNTAGYTPEMFSGQLINTTSYDGVRIISNSTISNVVVRVYGYRN